ncbi:MAG: thiamine pyrophosphate-dependent dehydrogenase E1 component subunit alpha [Verrucomicrobiae bacterium]|nr:thiamine pyrophosphate-dependent dehydrogenase E1 component subunit alpha [Verrucomicrobiae bacterium]
MVQSAVEPSISAAAGAECEFYLKAFRFMLLSRVLDEKFASLYRAGKIMGGVFLGRGQEALSVSIGVHLRPGDIFAPLIRDLAGRLAFNEPILDAARTYFGSALGPMRGRDGNVHRGRPQSGLLAMISHLGAMISVVNGGLFARRLRGVKGTVGVASCGEGATSTGSFHEALNQAAVEKLPLVMVVANNQFAYSTPTQRQFACNSLLDRAAGYGVAGYEVDGTDLEACLRVVGQAVAKARADQGPQLVLARLLRLCGHGEHDDAHYIGAELKASDLGQDCLKLAEKFVLQQGWVDAAQLEQWRAEAVQQVEAAVVTAQREPGPDPFSANYWSALSSQYLVEGGATER